MKNRIAKLVEIQKIEIFEEELPKLEKGQLLVAMKSVGICGSDMHYFKEGGLGSFKNPLPMHLGHEPAGVVVDSNGSLLFKDGDRVAVEPGMPCVTSYWSLKGKHNLCDRGTFMGANAQGAFADYVIVDELQLVKIPVSMSFDLASLMEPLGVCLHTANLIEPKFTESATIFGSGPIGLCMFSILKKMGVNEVYMIDKLKYRVDFAKEFGATESFLLSDDYTKKIKTLTKGFGTNITIDTGGTTESIDGCINMASVNGKVALIGIPESDWISYNPHKMRTKELTIKNVRRSNQTLDDCVKHYTNDLDIEKIVSHRFKFEDIQTAFETVASYGDKVLKCVITNNE
jgi:L-iditol 2-dehydrogenase